MSLLPKLLLVAAGGATGTICRYLLESRFSNSIVTLIINTLGSLIMGFLTGWLMVSAMPAGRKSLISILLMSGFCGGFSTFAHFAIISVNYLRQGATGMGLGYIVLTMGAGLACCFAGFLLGTRLTPA